MTATESPISLYRFFDGDGRLLYDGQTGQLGGRWYQHNKSKAWWRDVARSEVEHYPNRKAALRAERAAIETEHPIHNKVHNGGDPQRILILCSGCGKPIEDGDGYLENDILRHQQARWTHREQERHHREARLLGLLDEVEAGALAIVAVKEMIRDGLAYETTWHMKELLDHLPEDVDWQAWHRRCDPDPDSASYWIAVERIRTLQSFIHWSAHLSGKNWLEYTNWQTLMFAVAASDPPRIQLPRS